MDKIDLLFDKLSKTLLGLNRGLLIITDNLFYKKQIENYIKNRGVKYSLYKGDMTVNAFFELLCDDSVLVFDGLSYNKRGIDGLLYQVASQPMGVSRITFRNRKNDFNGRIILFGSKMIKNPDVNLHFQVWPD